MTLAPLGSASMALPEDSSVFFFSSLELRVYGQRMLFTAQNVKQMRQCRCNLGLYK